MVWRFFADYEALAEQFRAELLREHYLNSAGLKDRIELVPIFQRHAQLFERAAVVELLQHLNAGKRERYLVEFGVSGYLNDRTKELTERITNAMTRATVTWDEAEVPYRMVPTLLANESRSERRHDLDERAHRRTEEENPDRAERWRILHAAAAELGFVNYVDLCNRLRGLEVERLAGYMRALLDETAEHYFGELAFFLRQIGVPRQQATTADLTYVGRGAGFDALFPERELIPSLRRTLSGLGIDLDRQTNVELDTAPRPLKSPRAFCASIRVPDEIKLVIMPKGGRDDYRSLFHESGHAQHFAHADRNIPFALRRLGDVSATENYAFLMEHLTQTPAWLHALLGVRDAAALLRLARFSRLRLIRRYAAKLLYELELHVQEQVEPVRDRYAELLGEAQGVEVSPAMCLEDVDDGFYVAQYLRAWICEVQMRRFLEREFGETWFARRPAGEFLIDLWRHGLEYTADELAQHCGYHGLDPAPLIEDLREGMR